MTTLIALVATLLIIVMGIMDGGNIGNFINIPSVLITVGGTIGAAFVSYPVADVLLAFKACVKAVKDKPASPEAEIESIVSLSTSARRDGLLSLEHKALELDDPFMKLGLTSMVDGLDPELLQKLLENELDCMIARHSGVQAVLRSLSAYAPAFGMVGTLIGLVNMLQQLTDVQALGPSMAVALITTLYGVLLANLVFTPAATKLGRLNEAEVLRKELLIEGVLSIQDGENPRMLREKLETFLAPGVKLRRESDERGMGATGGMDAAAVKEG